MIQLPIQGMDDETSHVPGLLYEAGRLWDYSFLKLKSSTGGLSMEITFAAVSAYDKNALDDF